MAVYGEGYSILKDYNRKSMLIYPSKATDYGVPVRQGDTFWNDVKQLTNSYGIKGTRKELRYSTGRSVTQQIRLVDEWAVNDERKTIEESTEIYQVEFVSCTDGKCKEHDGYVVRKGFHSARLYGMGK